MNSLAIFSGFAVGVIVGLTGVGGGSLMTPLLIGVFRLSPAVAIGTDLWFAALTKLGGGWAHHRQGHVDRSITVQLLWGSLPAAAATLAVLALLQQRAPALDIGLALRPALGLALLLTALAVALRARWQALGQRLAPHLTPAKRARLTVASGVLLGVLVTLSSVGAGALGAMVLMLLHPQLHTRQVVGTDIAHAVPLTLLAGIGHAWMGHVDWPLLGALLLGSLPGIWLGARLTRLLPEGWVRTLLCVSLLGAGFKLLS
jgi:uncharacterized membrane protein YfcA